MTVRRTTFVEHILSAHSTPEKTPCGDLEAAGSPPPVGHHDSLTTRTLPGARARSAATRSSTIADVTFYLDDVSYVA